MLEAIIVKMKKSILFLNLFFINSECLSSSDMSDTNIDPLVKVNYKQAFDQTDIHKKFQSLLKKIGCSENTGQNEEEDPNSSDLDIPPREDGYSRLLSSEELIEEGDSINSDIIIIDKPSYEEDQYNAAYSRLQTEEWKIYEDACLSKIKWARRWSILSPAREHITTLLLIGSATAAVIKVLGLDSYGGGMGLLSATFNGIPSLRGLTRAGYNLLFTPTGPLDDLEKSFSINQCFIPKALWPQIIKNFMVARQNPYSQQECIQFLNFTLELRIFKPLPPIVLRGYNYITDYAISDTLRKLLSKLDDFFKDYKSFNEDHYEKLRMNICNFTLTLLGKGNQTRYLYLSGDGGVGKTFFASKLVEWLEYLIPDSIYFNIGDSNITSVEELEGTADKQGILLRVLRSQIMAKKRGSIVIMDEATWINQNDMVSAAKRVFNGALTRISTAYFGSGVDGTGIHLKAPPFLIILLANATINDEALRSRFDNIQFPYPTEDALLSYGKKLFEVSNLRYYLQLGNNMSLSEEAIRKVEECKTFRQIDEIIPTLVTKLP